MKLIPKAKPIRIRISSGGKEHSTLESLLDSFSIGDVRPLMENGMMLKWLNQIGESRLCAKIKSMSENLNGEGKWSNSDIISIFFDSPDKLAEYAENVLLRSEPDAMEYLKAAAGKASPAALYRLGCIYYFPRIAGVVTDIAKAEDCFKDAAELNHPLAKLAYGFIMCEKGQYSKAWGLIENTLDKLSDKDCRMEEDRQVIAKANYALAEIYWDGKRIVPQSSAKAIDLFRKSAELGYTRAYTRLGIIFRESKETYKALEYLEKARELKDVEGIYQLGLLYAETGKPDMDSARLFRMSAVGGLGAGMLKWGECLYLGKGVRKDAQQAIPWFERAYEEDIDGAAYYLGLCYAEGKGIIRNFETARDYFDKELIKRNSYYRSASEAKENLQRIIDGDVESFTEKIKQYQKSHSARISESELSKLAAKYNIPLSKAKSIALHYIIVSSSTELTKRTSYYESTAEAKDNKKQFPEEDVKHFTEVIKSYARMSEQDVYTIAARYNVPRSKAKSIASQYIIVL